MLAYISLAQHSSPSLLKFQGTGLTIEIVPIKIFGGVASFETISAMKFAVIPIMAINEQDSKRRERWKVIPRAPWVVSIAAVLVGWTCMVELSSIGKNEEV